MQAPTRANQITYLYYCTLNTHTWSAHRVCKMLRQNGTHSYFTYHLIA